MTAVIMVFVTLAVGGFLLYPWLRPRGERAQQDSVERGMRVDVQPGQESEERTESGDDE